MVVASFAPVSTTIEVVAVPASFAVAVASTLVSLAIVVVGSAD